MAGWSGYSLSDEILNYYYRGVAPSIGGILYLRLLVEPSSRSGGGVETNYSGYARLAMPRNTSSIFGVSPTNGRLSNTVQVAFPTIASAGNGDFVAFDIVDTASGAFAKVYNGGPVSPAKALVIGKPPTFRAGSLVLTF